METSGEKADREHSRQKEGQEGWQVETQPETIRDEADTSSESKKGKEEDKKRDKKPKKRGNNQREDVRNGLALENIENPTQESTRYPCFSNPFWTQSTWPNSTEYVPSRFSLDGPLLFSVLCLMFCLFFLQVKLIRPTFYCTMFFVIHLCFPHFFYIFRISCIYHISYHSWLPDSISQPWIRSEIRAPACDVLQETASTQPRFELAIVKSLERWQSPSWKISPWWNLAHFPSPLFATGLLI